MKTLKILLLLVTVVAFASIASAATVNISGAMSGNYTLNSMSVDSNGNVTLSVSSGNGTAAPTCTLNPNPSSVSSGGTTGLTWTISNGPANGSFTTAPGGTCTNFTSSSGGSCTTGAITASTNFGLTVSNANGSSTCYGYVTVGTTPPPSGAVNIGARYPNQILATIAANGENDYYFVLDTAASAAKVDMLTADWATNQDLIISPVRQPHCSDITLRYMLGPTFWYGPISSSNETVTANSSYTAGNVVYVAVCNRSSSTGQFKLSWTSY